MSDSLKGAALPSRSCSLPQHCQHCQHCQRRFGLSLLRPPPLFCGPCVWTMGSRPPLVLAQTDRRTSSRVSPARETCRQSLRHPLHTGAWLARKSSTQRSLLQNLQRPQSPTPTCSQSQSLLCSALLCSSLNSRFVIPHCWLAG